ncbi:MAG: ABC transporter permease [Opitutales bacterium]|nr:ABC transporter permease [Opitutales bacterium]
MDLFKSLSFGFRSLFQSNKIENDLKEEMEFHLEQQTQHYIKNGLSPKKARLAALQDFGGTEKHMDSCRDGWGMRFFAECFRNYRSVFRNLFRNKSFSATILLVLGLCVGANTSIFVFLNKVVFAPYPFDRSGDLLEILHYHDKTNPELALKSNLSTYAHYTADSESLRSASLHTVGWKNVEIQGETLRLKGILATSEFFETLKIPFVEGAVDSFQSVSSNSSPIVLTDSFRQSRFPANQNVLGQLTSIQGRTYKVVGVVSSDIQLLVPGVQFISHWNTDELAKLNSPESRVENHATLWARKNTSFSLPQTNIELEHLDNQFFAEQSESYRKNIEDLGYRTQAVKLRKFQNQWIRPKLLLLQGVSLMILIIGLVNITNMLLAQVNANKRDLVIRNMLGAGKKRLLGQMLAQITVYVAIGWILSITTALLGISVLKSVTNEIGQFINTPKLAPLDIGFSALLALCCGLVMFSARASGIIFSSNSALESNQQFSATKQSRITAYLLLTLQIGSSLTLLIITGLLAKSFWAAMNQESGFNPKGVITARIELPPQHYQNENQIVSLRDQLLDKAKAKPEFSSVAIASHIPTFGFPTSRFHVQETDQPRSQSETRFVFVSADYFQTMGIPILSGRSIASTDNAFWRENNVVEADAARHFQKDQRELIGQRFKIAPNRPKNQNWNQIVGVAANTRHEYLDKPQTMPLIYRPIQGTAAREFSLLIKTPLDIPQALRELRNLIKETAPLVPVFRIGSLEGFMTESLNARKGYLKIIFAYSLLALLLSSVGVFALLSYDVSRQIKEIGIRISIGASRTHIFWHVMKKGLSAGLIGSILGLTGAFLIATSIRSFLFETHAFDLILYLSLSTLILLLVTIASYLPSKMAVRVSPLSALRQE